MMKLPIRTTVLLILSGILFLNTGCKESDSSATLTESGTLNWENPEVVKALIREWQAGGEGNLLEQEGCD
jgi:hypothetical protein